MSDKEITEIIRSDTRMCGNCKLLLRKSTTSKIIKYGISEWGLELTIICRDCITKQKQKDKKNWKYYSHIWDKHLSNMEKRFYLFIVFSYLKNENRMWDIDDKTRWNRMDLVHQWYFVESLRKEGLPKRPKVCPCDYKMGNA